jgi:hypothetical protein
LFPSFLGGFAGQATQATKKIITNTDIKASLVSKEIVGENQTVAKEAATTKPVMWKRALDTASLRYGSNIGGTLPKPDSVVNTKNHIIIDENEHILPAPPSLAALGTGGRAEVRSAPTGPSTPQYRRSDGGDGASAEVRKEFGENEIIQKQARLATPEDFAAQTKPHVLLSLHDLQKLTRKWTSPVPEAEVKVEVVENQPAHSLMLVSLVSEAHSVPLMMIEFFVEEGRPGRIRVGRDIRRQEIVIDRINGKLGPPESEALNPFIGEIMDFKDAWFSVAEAWAGDRGFTSIGVTPIKGVADATVSYFSDRSYTFNRAENLFEKELTPARAELREETRGRKPKYPSKVSVPEELKSRRAKGWTNNAEALQQGKYPDDALYRDARSLGVKLPSARSEMRESAERIVPAVAEGRVPARAEVKKFYQGLTAGDVTANVRLVERVFRAFSRRLAAQPEDLLGKTVYADIAPPLPEPALQLVREPLRIFEALHRMHGKNENAAQIDPSLSFALQAPLIPEDESQLQGVVAQTLQNGYLVVPFRREFNGSVTTEKVRKDRLAQTVSSLNPVQESRFRPFEYQGDSMVYADLVHKLGPGADRDRFVVLLADGNLVISDPKKREEALAFVIEPEVLAVLKLGEVISILQVIGSARAELREFYRRALGLIQDRETGVATIGESFLENLAEIAEAIESFESAA